MAVAPVVISTCSASEPKRSVPIDAVYWLLTRSNRLNSTRTLYVRAHQGIITCGIYTNA